MNFNDALKKNANTVRTQNGAKAQKTTNSSLVDLYGTIGAMRNRQTADIERMFSQAFAEERLLAMKLLFYARDIRGGLGERRTARAIYLFLANLYPEVLKQNLELVSDFGRWDDLLIFLGTKLKDDVVELIQKQLAWDMDAEAPSLLAKWLPSNNTSSFESRKQAQILQKELHLTAKQYRQMLSQLRKKIDVVERNMAGKEWGKIDYQCVPSRAMNIYRKAFLANDEQRFNDYIEKVKAGEKKIHATTLYPYDIVEKILYRQFDQTYDVLEQQWNNLPDFIERDTDNILVMADVSGSMYGRPMATSIGLAIYFAQRSKGVFANHFMTFSQTPSIIKIVGNTLYEKVKMVMGSPWGMNTDFEKALYLILDTAVTNHATQEDLPKTLIVVSDMQFDQSRQETNSNWTFYRETKEMYRQYGYTIPEIVFWNVNSMSDVFQASHDYEGVKIASGQSPVVFRSILNSKAFTTYDFMLEVLNDERYDCVTV